MIKEIKDIEEKAKKLDVSKEEYALLEVLKKYIPGINEKEGAMFIKPLLGEIKPQLFPSWQGKKDVVLGPHGIEEKIFHRCFDEFSGKIKVEQLRAMVEQMVEYLKRFET